MVVVGEMFMEMLDGMRRLLWFVYRLDGIILIMKQEEIAGLGQISH